MKIVITEHHYSDIGSAIELAADAGVDVIVGQARGEDDAIELCRDADGVIFQHASVTDRMMEAWPRCRVIAHFGKGVDNIDVEAATRRGIWVVNVRDANWDEVSNHVIALVLAFARNLVGFDAHVRSGGWSYRSAIPRRRLAGQTMGIIGYGDIGKLVARKARALDMKVLVHARKPPPELETAFVSLDEVLSRADFLSMHIPLSPATRSIIGAPQLALMKPTAILINTSRGGVVDQAALIDALSGGRLAGAGLDVLDPEPPALDDPILQLKNVILTPHVAWYSEESREKVTTSAVGDALRVLAGKAPLSPVNPEVADRAKSRVAALTALP